MTKRQKIAITLFTVFIISRCIDIFITWYYTPDLAHEGNPFLLSLAGRDWSNILLITLFGIVFFAFFCNKLAHGDYAKPTFEEKLTNKLLNRDYSTAKKRYINDTACMFSISMIGFFALFLWVTVYGFRIEWVNKFLMLGSALNIVIILFIGWLLGKLVMTYVVQHYLKNHLSA